MSVTWAEQSRHFNEAYLASLHEFQLCSSYAPDAAIVDVLLNTLHLGLKAVRMGKPPTKLAAQGFEPRGKASAQGRVIISVGEMLLPQHRPQNFTRLENLTWQGAIFQL